MHLIEEEIQEIQAYPLSEEECSQILIVLDIVKNDTMSFCSAFISGLSRSYFRKFVCYKVTSAFKQVGLPFSMNDFSKLFLNILEEVYLETKDKVNSEDMGDTIISLIKEKLLNLFIGEEKKVIDRMQLILDEVEKIPHIDEKTAKQTIELIRAKLKGDKKW